MHLTLNRHQLHAAATMQVQLKQRGLDRALTAWLLTVTSQLVKPHEREEAQCLSLLSGQPGWGLDVGSHLHQSHKLRPGHSSDLLCCQRDCLLGQRHEQH